MISVENYNANRGIYSPLIEHNGIICGFWLCGQNYRNPSRLYGAYPPSYLKRMQLLFPKFTYEGIATVCHYSHHEVMHLFSGMISQNNKEFPGLTFDIKDYGYTSFLGDAEDLSAIWERGAKGLKLKLILADPPYNEKSLKEYGASPVNKRMVIKECAKVLRPGGHLVWLDTIIPIWAKADGWKLRGIIGLVQSTNHVCRVATILEKVML